MTEPQKRAGTYQRSTQAKLNARTKEKIALDLRLAGATYEQIADHVHDKESGEKLYSSKSVAWKAIDRAVKAIPAESAIRVKDLELQRLDVALMAIWPAVRRGDTFSIDRMLAIMNRRARYLGLDEKLEDDNTESVKTALTDFLKTASQLADQFVAEDSPEKPEAE